MTGDAFDARVLVDRPPGRAARRRPRRRQRVIVPPGPVAETLRRSTPRSRAILRTGGLASTEILAPPVSSSGMVCAGTDSPAYGGLSRLDQAPGLQAAVAHRLGALAAERTAGLVFLARGGKVLVRAALVRRGAGAASRRWCAGRSRRGSRYDRPVPRRRSDRRRSPGPPRPSPGPTADTARRPERRAAHGHAARLGLDGDDRNADVDDVADGREQFHDLALERAGQLDGGLGRLDLDDASD